jgi:ribosomal protein S18 acetylase RimI-like enzyme
MTGISAENVSFDGIHFEYKEAAKELLLACHPEATYGQVNALIESAFTSDRQTISLYGAYSPGKELIGFCLTQRIPAYRESHFGFGALVVDPRYRKRGIGEGLTRYAISILQRSLDMRRPEGTIELMQEGSSSEKFYEKMGFKTLYRDLRQRPIMVRTISGQALDCPTR